MVEGNSGTTNAVVHGDAVGSETAAGDGELRDGRRDGDGGERLHGGRAGRSRSAGQTSGTIAVAVSGRQVVEPDETFTVTLSTPVNATLATATGTGTIANDDCGADGEHRAGDGGGGEQRDDGRGVHGDAVGSDAGR